MRAVRPTTAPPSSVSGCRRASGANTSLSPALCAPSNPWAMVALTRTRKRVCRRPSLPFSPSLVLCEWGMSPRVPLHFSSSFRGACHAGLRQGWGSPLRRVGPPSRCKRLPWESDFCHGASLCLCRRHRSPPGAPPLVFHCGMEFVLWWVDRKTSFSVCRVHACAS